jgi:hypothetical protein
MLCNAGACCLQVVTAKSSEVNQLVLAANAEAEEVAEHAVYAACPLTTLGLSSTVLQVVTDKRRDPELWLYANADIR